MAEFDRAIATALRLIKKKGQLVQWKQVISSTPDADKPWEGGVTADVSNDVYICFVPVKDRATRQFFQYLSKSEVPIGSLAGLMGQVLFEPSLKDIVIRDGVELSLASIDLLSPNGQKIFYTLEFNG